MTLYANHLRSKMAWTTAAQFGFTLSKKISMQCVRRDSEKFYIKNSVTERALILGKT